MTRLLRRGGGLAAACSLVMLMAGCGDGRPARVPVSGQVLIDGQPVTCGFISIAPEDARMSTGQIGADGRFTMSCFGGDDGVVPGTHKATVAAFRQIDDATRQWFAPKKYSEIETSGLTVTIDGATDSLLVNLTWGGGKPFVERFVGGQWH